MNLGYCHLHGRAMPADKVEALRLFRLAVERGGEKAVRGCAYRSHLISVSALVMENGGNETEAIAALLHNARAILADYEVDGDQLWQRFTANTKELQLWYYSELARTFTERAATLKDPGLSRMARQQRGERPELTARKGSR